MAGMFYYRWLSWMHLVFLTLLCCFLSYSMDSQFDLYRNCFSFILLKDVDHPLSCICFCKFQVRAYICAVYQFPGCYRFVSECWGTIPWILLAFAVTARTWSFHFRSSEMSTPISFSSANVPSRFLVPLSIISYSMHGLKCPKCIMWHFSKLRLTSQSCDH